MVCSSWVTDVHKEEVTKWFSLLRERIVDKFFMIESEFSDQVPTVKKRSWNRSGGGGGESVVLYGTVFEKAGVNFSTVYGKMQDGFAAEIPGAAESGGEFWASGVSVVAHMCSPFVPAVHMNTRFVCTSKGWFGGGIDLTPIYSNDDDTEFFHDSVRATCDKFNSQYYSQFKKNCDEYFYLAHRREARGVGGIFYDYLQGDFDNDFAFTRAVGECFMEVYPAIVQKRMHQKWSEEEREYQLLKRGRYVEFNLIYDRGTRFGLMTDGDPDAIMMSMPPLVKWV
ncbi:oxygen-dependent coproporphyrinogen oxidase [Candidatus Anaplasma sp. TIGMIC]|nr:oxygen-dependent coproporphyrinogen oxidase [Candidatus Anaplasma sp. TIGMIC]MDB1135713.1 oxygen-dependent coproporphyrinogen oxidase [Candidatus Anaplasma sp. TIGMIC]